MPRERIELSASSLPMTRSTTELPRLRKCLLKGRRAHCLMRPVSQAKLEREAGSRQGSGMTDPKPALTREERMAAKLRENLRRRKAQAREMNVPETLPKGDSAG